MSRKLLAAAVLLAVAAAVLGQNKVHLDVRVTKKYEEYLPKKGDAIIEGTVVSESPAGIKIKTKGKEGKEVLIAPSDVLFVEYDVGKKAADFRAPLSRIDNAITKQKVQADRDKALEKAIGELKAQVSDLGGSLSARKYVEYKIAEATAYLAQGAKPNVVKRDEAIKLLKDFATLYPDFWTIVPALKTLAKLQEEANLSEDASKTYEQLANVKDVPKELKQESEILVGRLLLRGSKFADAEKRLQKLAEGLSEGDAQKPFVQAYLAEAKIGQNKTDGVAKELDGVIKGSADAKLRGVAYNLMGDLHVRSGKLEDAFWAYLRVDVLYGDDADEQAKALYNLSTLYDKVKKDPARGEECIRRLRDPRFAGTTYQKLLPADKDETEKKEEKPMKDEKKK